jgi:hypothetical protein
MIEKVVQKADLGQFDEVKQNLAYWLSKSQSERVSAVEHLRRQRHGDTEQILRTLRVFRLSDMK